MVSLPSFRALYWFAKALSETIGREVERRPEQRFALFSRIGGGDKDDGHMFICLGDEMTFVAQSWQFGSFRQTGRLQFSGNFRSLGDWDMVMESESRLVFPDLSDDPLRSLISIVRQISAAMPR